MKWFFTLLKAIAFIPFYLLYPVKVIGKKNLPKGKVIVVGNHLSAMDIVVQLANLPGFRYTIAKKELNKNKFIGKFLSWLGAIYMDRDKADLVATKKVLGVLKKGYGLSMYPEGHRNRTEEDLLPIKEGAAMFAIKSKSQVVPVIIYKKLKMFSMNYIMVGQPLDLDEFYSGRLDAMKLKSASDLIESSMRNTQSSLADYVFYNKTKKGKRIKKDGKKALRSLARAAREITA